MKSDHDNTYFQVANVTDKLLANSPSQLNLPAEEERLE